MKVDDKETWGHFKKVLDDYRPEFDEKSWTTLRAKLNPASSLPFSKTTFLKLSKLAIACTIVTAVIAGTYWMMESRQSHQKIATKFRDVGIDVLHTNSARADTSILVEQKSALVATNADLAEATPAIYTDGESTTPSGSINTDKLTTTTKKGNNSDSTKNRVADKTAYSYITRIYPALQVWQPSTNLPFVYETNETGSYRMRKPYELSIAYSPLILQGFRGNLIRATGWSVGIGRNITDKYMITGELRLSSLRYDASLKGLPLFIPNSPTSRDLLHNLTAEQVRYSDSVSIWCHMNYLEIGVSISRSVLSWNNSHLDLQAGLSTYIMLKESYADSFTIGDSTFLYHENYGALKNSILPINVRLGARWQQQLSELLGLTLSSTYTIAATGAGATRQKWNSMALQAGVTLSIGRKRIPFRN